MIAWDATAGCVLAVVTGVLAAPPRPGAERRFGAGEVIENPVLDVAYALDLLALALSGGAPVTGALDDVAQASGRKHVQVVLGRVGAALRWGVDGERAWEGAPVMWDAARRAFTLAGRAGVAPAQVLRRTADDLRAAETERIAAAGARAGTTVVLPLGLCFLPAFLLITVVPLVLGLITPA